MKRMTDIVKDGMGVEEQDKLVEAHTGPNQTTRLRSSLRWRRSASLSASFREDRTNSDRQSHRQGVCLFVSSRFDDVDISMS